MKINLNLESDSSDGILSLLRLISNSIEVGEFDNNKNYVINVSSYDHNDNEDSI